MEYLHNGFSVSWSEWVERLAKALSKSKIVKEHYDSLLSDNYDTIDIEGVEYSADMFLEQIAPNHYHYLFLDYCRFEGNKVVEYRDEYDNVVNGEHFIARIKEEK